MFLYINLLFYYSSIHIRRNDKKTEAVFYKLSEYMQHVDRFYEDFFIQNPNVNDSKTVRTVYLSTDDFSAIDEIKR